MLIFFAAQQVNAAPIDNGDGTVTFVTTFKGLPEMVELPERPRPLTGTLASSASTTPSMRRPATSSGRRSRPSNGPHPDADSGFTLFCDVIVPALS